METDETWMQRALDLAVRGRGRVEPNPMVGCIIVRDGRIIGQGFHERFGQPHAERNALANCTESPAGATAYVTLEPCCHTNKKTPPCVPALIDAKIGRVVAACADPNPAVSGNGFRLLRDAGIEVITGVRAAEAQQLNAAFFCGIRERRPYITLKWAQSADGLLAGANRRTVRISNPAATAQIHAMRSRCDAILVGINTVLSDDPLLTARGVPDARPLKRMVLDTNLRLPMRARLVQSAREHEVWVFCSPDSSESRRAASLRDAGVRVIACGMDDDGRIRISQFLTWCMGITHLLVEPGPTVAKSFFQTGMVDRVWMIRSQKAISEPDAPRAPTIDWPAIATVNLDGDELTEYLNPSSPVFFAPAASADFQLLLND